MNENNIILRADSGERIRPLEGSPRGTFVGRVTANRAVCTDHYRLTLAVAGFPASVPGQFVQVDCRGHGREEGEGQAVREFEWAAGAERVAVGDADFGVPVAYLRRPFSIADQRVGADGVSELDIIHRVVGRGTGLLARLKVGEEVSLLGPLGVGFRVPVDLEWACLVGWDVGVPPMLYLARHLAERARGGAGAGKGCRRVAFFGAQRGDLLAVKLVGAVPATGGPGMTVGELAPWDVPAVITTDDGSVGRKGFVTEALRDFLAGRPAGRMVVYCCGPTPMMKATARVAEAAGVECQVSLEQPMACGMGTCQSCVIKYRPHSAAPETEWKYKLTCTDGPVFDSRDIVW